MRKIFLFVIALLCNMAMVSCGGLLNNNNNFSEVEDETDSVKLNEEKLPKVKSTSEIIQDAVDEQDFNEVNRMMSKLLSDHEFDLDKAKDTWKQELKYCLKNNEFDVFIDMISVINTYELKYTPIVNEKSEISPSVNDRYVEEVGKFNEMCDNFLNIAILYENAKIANQIINLYRKGIRKKVKKEPKVETYEEEVGTREEKYYEENNSIVGEFFGLQTEMTRTVPIYKTKQRTIYVEVYEWVWSTDAQDAARKTLRNAGLNRKKR